MQRDRGGTGYAARVVAAARGDRAPPATVARLGPRTARKGSSDRSAGAYAGVPTLDRVITRLRTPEVMEVYTRRSFFLIGNSVSYTRLMPVPSAFSSTRMSRTNRRTPSGSTEAA